MESEIINSVAGRTCAESLSMSRGVAAVFLLFWVAAMIFLELRIREVKELKEFVGWLNKKRKNGNTKYK